jgi:branched-subunit amino acid aminotransferase/4-amino-4-deoxychorismate lyase
VIPEQLWHGAFIFTTVRLVNGQPLWIDKHLNRLKQHSEDLGLGFAGFDKLELEISKHQQAKGLNLLRLVCSGTFVDSSLRPLIPPTPEDYRQGVKVHISTIQIHPQLGRYKTGNYLPYRLAKKEADAAGAFEGLLLDSAGNVVDGSRSSLLLFHDDILYSLQGGLAGITRDKVLEKASDFGLQTARGFFGPEQITGQLLLAGTGMGLVPVGNPADSRLIQLIKHFEIAPL